MSTSDYICETENITAYIEGDLDPALEAALEGHLKECARCGRELQSQRQFTCELEAALASPFALSIPENFAQVVAVNAKSDMRGIRNLAERTRALSICLVLGAAAVALLGFSASKAVIFDIGTMTGKVFRVLAFFADAIFDAVGGLAVISRVITRGLISNSRPVGFAGLLFLALAIAVLSRLIARYHRTRFSE